MTSNDFADSEYLSSNKTVASKIEEEKVLENVEIEAKRYGNSKPVRVILRARVLHD